MHARYREREREYWEAKIARHAKDPKRLWATFNGLLGRHGAGSLSKTPEFSAKDFAAYCESKIGSIRGDTAGSPPLEFPPTVHRMATLREISSVELRSVIMSSAPKSCELDSLLASLIQDYVDNLLPFLTLLCNRSLQEGVLPDPQKRSVIFPALKRDGLDLKDPSNFRPISNISFLSKIIEKIVSEQITSYLSTNDLLPKYQSGFHRGHSTETLLLRLLSD